MSEVVAGGGADAARPATGDSAGWLSEIESARSRVLDTGRPEAVARQHELGKLTARERVGALLDDGSVVEYGALASAAEGYEHLQGVDAPADGVITALGTVHGRAVSVIASDFTVIGGSIGHAGIMKMVRHTDFCLENGVPLVMLLDGGGHRIQEGLDSRSFAFGGPGTFPTQAMMSGWVPQVVAIMGPGFAGPANFSSLSDFVPMVRGTASIGIAGPPLVRFATGEVTSAQELGGADLHTRTGVADAAYDDDLACIEAIKAFLAYLPQNAGEASPMRPTDDPPDRLIPELRSIVPENRRRAYDVRKVLRHVVDDGVIFELKASCAPNVVTAFAHLDGRAVGLVASQPRHLAGVLDSAACDKVARFISMCDAFGLPILTFIDLPGFLVGREAEESALVRHSGKIIMALGNATVPIVSFALRKGYGLGYLALAGGRSFGAVGAFAWPSAEVCAMQVEGAVDIAFKKDYSRAPDPLARRAELIDSFYANVNPIRAASGFGIDDVIDPAETRAVACTVLSYAGRRRRKAFPPRLHSIEPV